MTKVELHLSLKGYSGEKCAQDLTSRLEGRAFDIYMRLSDEDKKDVSTIKAQLLKEFERRRQDREEAIYELSHHTLPADESVQTFAYKLIELVKLAYPSFEDNVQEAIAKDYVVKGLHQDMQVALKSLENFSSSDINLLATEETRLRPAGINCLITGNIRVQLCGSKAFEINAICEIMDQKSLIDSIADKVVEKLKVTSIDNMDEGARLQQSTTNFVGNQRTYSQGGYGYRRQGQGRVAGLKGRFRQGRNKPATVLKCRSCQSTEHLVRDCPTRFCQACGHRGHDAWDNSCPNYH